MLKQLSLILALALIFIQAQAQSDPQAASILEKSAKKIDSYKTIKGNFTFYTYLPQTKEPQTEKGSFSMKGAKYHLLMAKSEIVYDGKDIYTVLKDANEVNITKPEPVKNVKGNFFLSNPRDVFKLYNKNFKSKLIQEIEVSQKLCYEIDLYPKDLKTQYQSIRVHVEKSSLHIVNMQMKFKDGTRQMLQFDSFTPDKGVVDSEFKFDESRFPGVQMNDMRF
jgi:outer membrane lipoprotein-sorting protein